MALQQPAAVVAASDRQRGARHPTVQPAGRCLENYRRRGFSDRIVVAIAIAVDAAWPPTGGRYLNDAELDELYGNSG